jgi:hypothetical protein
MCVSLLAWAFYSTLGQYGVKVENFKNNSQILYRFYPVTSFDYIYYV